MRNRFPFYEVVVFINYGDDKLKAHLGVEGTILGMAQDENTSQWIYSVAMPPKDLAESQLTSTGKHRNLSDFYTNEVVKVRVAPNTGKGSLA